jgi:hypothetical protein
VFSGFPAVQRSSTSAQWQMDASNFSRYFCASSRVKSYFLGVFLRVIHFATRL